MLVPNLEEVMSRKEDLNPELLAYLERPVGGMSMLRHPLLYDVPYSEGLNALHNVRFEYKKMEAEKALKKGDILGYVFIHERPWRRDAFEDAVFKRKVPISDKKYWEILSAIWVDSENISVSSLAWKKLLKSPRKNKEFFMESRDRKAFQKMPDILKIYRGYSALGINCGFSYTLNREVAEFFANRFSRTKGAGKVIEKVIKKNCLFAYISTRGEEEVIYLH